MSFGIFAFLLTFVRIGAAIIIMPGVGDSFTPSNIRLVIGLALSFVMTPLVIPYLPDPIPTGILLALLIVMEFIIGLFIGTIARTIMTALDTGGMIISLMSGLGNAQIFNPASSTQGSLIGALLSVTGIVVLFVTNLHHLLFMGLIETYEIFPVGVIPDTGEMAGFLSKTVAQSFMVGFQIAAPFMIVGMLVYISMGILTRLMPQVQVFIMSLPLQISLSFMSLLMIVGTGLMFWAGQFQEQMTYLFTRGG